MFVSAPKGLLSPNSSSMFSSMWVLDSAASHHMSSNLSFIASLCPISSVSIMTADGVPMPLAGVGSIVNPIYYFLSFIVSIDQLCDSGYSVSFSSISCHVQDL